MLRFPALLALGLAAVGGCMVVPQAVGRDAAHVMLAAIAALLTVLVAAVLHHAHRHRQVATGLARLAYRGSLAGEPVELVPGLDAPLVAGLRAPRVFCGDDLHLRLDEEELRAVILHEQHHRRDRAPLRLVALSGLGTLVGRTAAGRAWIERERARIEIAADAHALAAGVSRAALAGALLKVSTVQRFASAPGFATATDLRVRALLGEPTGLDLDRRLGWTATAALVVAACLVVYLT